MSVPVKINRADILTALDWIDADPTRIPRNRRVKKFALVARSNKYPPKFVISKAYGLKHGTDWQASMFGGGREANNFLIVRKFAIFDLSKNPRVKVSPQAVDEDPPEVFKEGGSKLFDRHVRIEKRNGRLVHAAKNLRLKVTGDLKCEACGFSFFEPYGDLGFGFIEAHHKIPLNDLKGERNVRVEDLALLCSNCHRMIHKTNPLLEVKDLKALLKAQNKK